MFTVFRETAAKGRFEMTCRQDDRFGYIWNEWSDGAREYRAENMMGRTWPAMLAAASSDERLAQRARFCRHRVPEELYDLRADPHSLAKLAEDPSHREGLKAARRHLLAWMAETGDPLLDTYRGFLQDLEQRVVR